MMKILVLGSCVTRDAFEFAKDSDGIKLVEYFARSSMASLYAKPLKHVDLSAIASNFQRRIVGYDLLKTFEDYVKCNDFNCFIYDPIDERFNVLDYGNSVRVTLSPEASVVLDESGGKVIRSGSDEFFELWELGWAKTYALLAGLGSPVKILINNVRWSTQLESGLGFKSSYSREDIAKANAFLDRLYERISRDLGRESFIHKEDSVFVSSDHHKWGHAPFHYRDDVYEAVINKVRGLSMSLESVTGGVCKPIDAKVDFVLKGSVVDSHIVVENPCDDDTFYFYLCRNGVVQERSSSWSKVARCSFELKESGSYFVQGYVRRRDEKKIIYSDVFTFLSDADREKVDSFLNEKIPAIEYPADKVFNRKYPYTDYLVCSWAEDVDKPSLDKLDSVFRDNSMRVKSCLSAKCILVSGDEAEVDVSGSGFSIFTGSFFEKGELIFGSKDFYRARCDLEAEDRLGSYSYVKIDSASGTVNIYTDYFGHNKAYVYSGKGVVCVSNNYHFLLVFLKGIGVGLSIDLDKVLSRFVFTNIQLFSQNYSSSMEVSPVSMLPPHKRFVLEDGKLYLKDKELAGSLVGHHYNEKDFRELIEKARDEVVDNVKAVCRHPGFDHVIVDLSGGLDSRTVFAAVTNVDGFDDKIKLNSYEVASQPDDFKVALELASIYEYRFDDLPRVVSSFGGSRIPVSYWSYTLGSYYSAVPLSSRMVVRRAARLTGAYGETCARPYYAARFFGSELDVREVSDFCELYIDRFRKDALDGVSVDLDVVKKIMIEALDELPGNTALEKLENHYLFYRNDLHFSDQFRSQTSCPEFGPIQSKSLHKAKMMAFNRFDDSRVQHNLLSLLNPLLASMPFEKKSESELFERLSSKGQLLSPDWIRSLKVPTDSCAAQEKHRMARSKIKSMPESDAEVKVISEISGSVKESSLMLSLAALRYLLDKDVLPLGLVETVFYNLSLNGALSDYRRWVIINRVISLYVQSFIVFEWEGV